MEESKRLEPGQLFTVCKLGRRFIYQVTKGHSWMTICIDCEQDNEMRPCRFHKHAFNSLNCKYTLPDGYHPKLVSIK